MDNERNIRRTILPNGLTILTEKMDHIRSVAMGVWVRAGSRHEMRRDEWDLAFCGAHGLQGHEDRGRRR